MSPSLRALLAGLIDYAGQFPPAELPLDKAIRNYAQYRQTADAWMLGRFISLAEPLAKLARPARLFQSGEPFAFSLLTTLGSLSEDLEYVTALRDRDGARIAMDVIEMQLPPRLGSPAIGRVAVRIEEIVPANCRVYFESTLGEDWRTRLPLEITYLRDHFASGRVGFKLRCGGLEASAFRPVELVAFALRTALDAGVPFKATAGLHHPFPRFDASVQAVMHGFINLFVAGTLAHWRELSEEQMCAILKDAEPAHFTFDDEGVSWQGLRASTAEISVARRESVLSFGSCSFDEPRDDLRALGWL